MWYKNNAEKAEAKGWHNKQTNKQSYNINQM